jgi:MYND finger
MCARSQAICHDPLLAQLVARCMITRSFRCQIDRYCSVECQKAAWPVHKQICQHNMVALQESIANGQYTSKGSKDSQRWCLQYTEEITRLSAYALHALPPAECLAEDYVLLVLAKYDEDERSVRLLKAERLPKNVSNPSKITHIHLPIPFSTRLS